MPNWSRVFNYEPVFSLANCYNFTGCCGDNAGAASAGSILNEFPLSVQTVAQAFSIFTERLRKRVGATEATISTRSGSSDFTIVLRFGRGAYSTAIVELTLAGGRYPVSCTYTRGVSSGSGMFGTQDDLLTWLVDRLSK